MEAVKNSVMGKFITWINVDLMPVLVERRLKGLNRWEYFPRTQEGKKVKRILIISCRLALTSEKLVYKLTT